MTQKGSTGLSTVLIIVAVALVGGFFLWLYRSAAALDEATPVLVEDQGDAGEVVDLVVLSQDPSASVGRVADIVSVAVVQSLGRGVFLMGLASANETSPFPVLLSPDLIARNTKVYGGDVVRLHGRIYSLNDSIRSQWVELGAVDEAAAEAIPQVTSFLLADSLELK